MADLAADAREFLSAPGRYATLATIDPDGSPLQAVVWYELQDDGTILVNSLEGR
ncbi:MAG: pyridoxamine 5'-phosphate oxidase family protein, partial [Candidatus Limnocylindrales bacterium]